MQKGQLELARRGYDKRIKRFKKLGLKSEYGMVFLTAAANNLRNATECRPAVWKERCSGAASEADVVDCMIEEYIAGTCRGSERGTRERAEVIRKAFAGHKNDPYREPPADIRLIESCSTRWGQSSGAHPPRKRSH